MAPSPLNARLRASAVWTGLDMIVYAGSYNFNGARYRPSTDTWQMLPEIDAPIERDGQVAVWAGDRMIAWGGNDGTNFTDTGGLYDPATESWAPTTTSGPPQGRMFPAAVWTGSFLMVWGGGGDDGLLRLGDGGRYAYGQMRDDDSDGFSECTGDCNDANPFVHPGGIETCNGLDDDCNGLFDDAVVPGGRPAITVTRQAGATARLAWAPIAAATGYDLVSGSSGLLASSHGDFAASLQICLANDQPQTTSDDARLPGPGQGYFYLVRAMSCGGSGSYDESEPSQAGSRDPEIQASSAHCP